MSTSNKITIDQLAGMMITAFTSLEKRFDKLESKVDKLDYRMEVLESKITINHENRISKTEDDVRIIKTKLNLGGAL